ncbi:MAG: putative toxin-antitoxin system toxin component, PIN family [Nitrospirota bacterium]
MIKTVIDTNIFVSSVIKKKGTSSFLIERWKKKEFILFVSESIIKEILEVLSRPRIRAISKMTKEEIKKFGLFLYEGSRLVEPKISLTVCQDLDDNKFLECAIEAGVDYIVSGDKHLLNLGEYEGIKILTPKKFREALEG